MIRSAIKPLQGERLFRPSLVRSPPMDIAKSTRHSHITGMFAEALVLYWLSRDGSECTRVDHTGIDLLANNCRTGSLMGISVKSRSRSTGTESTALTWNKDFHKVDAACAAFRCEPYYAIVVDAGDRIRLFLLSKEHFISAAGVSNRKLNWGMTKQHLERYRADKEIKCVEFSVSVNCWWDEPRPSRER